MLQKITLFIGIIVIGFFALPMLQQAGGQTSLELAVVSAEAFGGGGGDGCGGCGGGGSDGGGGYTPPVVPSPSCVLNAHPTSITLGGSSQLSWTSQNAVSASLNQGIGSVSVNGNRSVSPQNTTTYTLTVTNSAGVSATCERTITVTQPEVFTCTNNVSFSANPTSIVRGGSSTLTWTVNGADSVRFDQGIAATTLSGAVTVSPTNTTTYNLIAKKGTSEISCPVTVSVTTGGGGGGGGYVIPTCDLTASKRTITSGEAVRLTWTSRNANEMEIKDNHRVVHVTTDGKSSSQKRDLLNGSITVNPTKNTTYTLTVENNNGRKRVCEVVVNVSTVITQVRDQQPVVTGIVLTEVPYTGFEAGPALTVLFYTLLVLWALYMTYIFVIRPKLAVVPVEVAATVTTKVEENFPHMFTPEVTRPTMVTPSVATPVTTAPIGYSSVPVGDEATRIEEMIHGAHILMSGVAMDYFMTATAGRDRIAAITEVIENAKASFPSEGGWVVLNEERIKQILA